MESLWALLQGFLKLAASLIRTGETRTLHMQVIEELYYLHQFLYQQGIVEISFICMYEQAASMPIPYKQYIGEEIFVRNGNQVLFRIVGCCLANLVPARLAINRAESPITARKAFFRQIRKVLMRESGAESQTEIQYGTVLRKSGRDTERRRERAKPNRLSRWIQKQTPLSLLRRFPK